MSVVFIINTISETICDFYLFKNLNPIENEMKFNFLLFNVEVI